MIYSGSAEKFNRSLWLLSASNKLSGAIFIGMGHNLDALCIPEMSSRAFLDLSKFPILTRSLAKKRF